VVSIAAQVDRDNRGAGLNLQASEVHGAQVQVALAGAQRDRKLQRQPAAESKISGIDPFVADRQPVAGLGDL